MTTHTTSERPVNLRVLRERKPDEKLVKNIERLLEDAKKGEITGMAYVVMYHDYDFSDGWANLDGMWARTLIGQLTLLKQRITDIAIADEDEMRGPDNAG